MSNWDIGLLSIFDFKNEKSFEFSVELAKKQKRKMEDMDTGSRFSIKGDESINSTTADSACPSHPFDSIRF